jgi:hypothetical protein
MDEHSDQPRGFRVNDRRRFTGEGEEREETAPETPADTSATEPLPEPDAGARGQREAPVTFSTFVLGLSTQALLHLGEIPDPSTGRPSPDLVAAKQVIDILGMLLAKTTNNLEQDERSLLDSVLYDLRMRYVTLVRAGANKEGA